MSNKLLVTPYYLYKAPLQSIINTMYVPASDGSHYFTSMLILVLLVTFIVLPMGRYSLRCD